MATYRVTVFWNGRKSGATYVYDRPPGKDTIFESLKADHWVYDRDYDSFKITDVDAFKDGNRDWALEERLLKG